MPTIIIASIVFILLALAVTKIIKDQKKGSCACGSGGCGGCPHSAACGEIRQEPDKNNKTT